MGAHVLKLNDPVPAWWSAMYRWEQEGNAASVHRLLRASEDMPIPPFARRWLADVLSGKVKRKRGPKHDFGSLQTVLRRHMIAFEYQSELAMTRACRALKPLGGTPSEIVIEQLAERHGMSAASVWRAISAAQSPTDAHNAKLRELIERYSQ